LGPAALLLRVALPPYVVQSAPSTRPRRTGGLGAGDAEAVREAVGDEVGVAVGEADGDGTVVVVPELHPVSTKATAAGRRARVRVTDPSWRSVTLMRRFVPPRQVEVD
jgi:hypothetical protein